MTFLALVVGSVALRVGCVSSLCYDAPRSHLCFLLLYIQNGAVDRKHKGDDSNGEGYEDEERDGDGDGDNVDNSEDED